MDSGNFKFSDVKFALALITNDRKALKGLLAHGDLDVDPELHAVALATLSRRSEPWTRKLVAAAHRAPAWLQYLAQRAVLLEPRVAREILFRTGIHHESF